MLDGHGNPQLALFTANGLRLSPQGYALWQQGIDAQLTRMRLQTLPRPPPSPPLLSHCFAMCREHHERFGPTQGRQIELAVFGETGARARLFPTRRTRFLATRART